MHEMETTMKALMRWSAAAMLIATLPFVAASTSQAAWHHHHFRFFHFGGYHHYHGGGAGSFLSRPRNAESA
jgi:hypothetical protein